MSNSTGSLQQFGQVVADQDDAQALLGQRLHDAVDGVLGADVHAHGGPVQDQHARRDGEPAADQHALPVAAGQRPHRARDVGRGQHHVQRLVQSLQRLAQRFGHRHHPVEPTNVSLRR
jgi:hypothetical protein